MLTYLFPPSNWERDELVTTCPCCDRQFTCWIRKHHCRVCLRVVCHTCSWPQEMDNHQSLPRTCRMCRAIRYTNDVLLNALKKNVVINDEHKEDEKEVFPRMQVTSTNGLDVYTEPLVDSPVVCHLSVNEIVSVQNVENAWVRHSKGWSLAYDERKNEMSLQPELSWCRFVVTTLTANCLRVFLPSPHKVEQLQKNNIELTDSLASFAKSSFALSQKIRQDIRNKKPWIRNLAATILRCPHANRGFWTSH